MFFREALRRCFFKKTLQIFLYIHKIPFLVILRLSFTFCILLTLLFIFHFPFIKIIFFCFYFCSWGPRLNRHLNDWEVGEVESFLGKLFPMTIRRGVDDLLRWKENKNGTFSVKSFYSSLSRGIKTPSRPELFGQLGSRLELASLVGRRLGVGCSPLTVWRDLVGAFPTGAFCVKRRMKPYVTFFCFVKRPECYDFWFSPSLGCNGWCTPLWIGTS